MKDFSLVRDAKSTRFPHAFMAALDSRLAGVLQGKEKMPEYNDSLVKRTFATFLNEFMKPQFRKNVENSRRVEDLVLIFFANATKELQKGKLEGDDSWRLMVDRHVALFIRLISAILRDNDWARERPELASRLQTMEKKLLVHDQDLSEEATRNGGAGGHSIEVEIPLSYEVKDMPLVLTVSRVFGVPYERVQEDINRHKSVWTEKAALQDLKIYQTSLSINGKRTLNSEDFDTDEAYEVWKKAETADISQMILAIIQSNLELAKTTTSAAALPHLRTQSSPTSDSGYYSDMSRKMSDHSENGSSYVIDQPVDMSQLSLGNGNEFAEQEEEIPFTFLPTDPRNYYRSVLKEILIHDIRDQDLQPTEATAEVPAMKLFSKQSTELLTELALRWRIPQFSRPTLFLDAVRELYQNQEIDLDTLDAAFIYFKEPHLDKKANRRSAVLSESLSDWHKWTVADYALHHQVLSSIHDLLLRELFELMLGCYEAKTPAIGPLMYVLNEHIYNDPLFSKSEEAMQEFSNELREALRLRSAEAYRELLSKNIPNSSEDWEFYHVIQLGKDVVKFAERIQKRYRKTPTIMGVSPLMVLVEEVLPNYAADARDLVERIIKIAADRSDEIPIQDGFDMYSELVEIRKVHAQVLPEVPFGLHIEGLLQAFVWRWIQSTDAKIVGWVEEAVKQDAFLIDPEVGADGGRHSVSIVDIFRSFTQAMEQIVQLNWDDDLQYAKFMTAISKAIGAGVAKYCELMEQRFVKEMDRLSPEQEATLSQTRQEKWMQLAKEAWTSKDKVEPFQFLPESLVKLNNIEYAMLQLDKLEREINVDACAEVIQKHEPPPAQRQKKLEKYVFTIKIIEAEDLKACDVGGTSDPYVVLGDEYQKRLAKTRIIYANLNPRWDESVDIVTTGPLNIIATIWDWDALGDHDCVGRTSLKLDPSHFRDFLPREYWLDLDTQGRLLLRVSMEGESDDIQFYFGKAFRTLKRCERDMTRKITDKVFSIKVLVMTSLTNIQLSAYIHHCLSRQRLKQLLSKGITMHTVTSYFQRNRPPTFTQQAPTQMEITNALKPLFNYFNDNFAIMKTTLTDSGMVMVMTRLWKEVLVTIESLLVPPLSDKPSQQRPLTQQELDIVFKWLQVSTPHSNGTNCADSTSYFLTSSTPLMRKRAFPMAFPWMF